MRKFPYNLRLFIDGTSIESIRALKNIENVCKKYLEHRYALEVTDIAQRREAMSEFNITAIPTLIRIMPDGEKRLVGDLSSERNILWFLEIQS